MCRFRLREAGSGWGRNDTLRRFVIPAHDFSDGVLLIPRYRAIQYLGARRVNVRSADGNSGRTQSGEMKSLMCRPSSWRIPHHWAGRTYV
ncbi:hypothetical protein ALQ16_201733 [Pseudomonas syringae pv. actinidiae]|uniref:Uncharacterized protein n=2 Tax=Pseudomonas syringae group TaxID=136849 RepID=A0AAN4QDB0_PSESF|nr:hypothetical protein ALO90_200175 [Pseudomonas amygdali pv. aesculi]RML95748.1 hypothetical protein ALQ86_200040 [Pseudomonas amygdali pv. eriobotryae]RMP89695.1 hypothetical protein ALQ16_201733 [Pseudomonas syringae pv. actinidiae]GBH21626.1 hypothetical protein KPSA3_07676 [Pseudomonas syringae pv. actinidiae]